MFMLFRLSSFGTVFRAESHSRIFTRVSIIRPYLFIETLPFDVISDHVSNFLRRDCINNNNLPRRHRCRDQKVPSHHRMEMVAWEKATANHRFVECLSVASRLIWSKHFPTLSSTPLIKMKLIGRRASFSRPDDADERIRNLRKTNSCNKHNRSVFSRRAWWTSGRNVTLDENKFPYLKKVFEACS